MAVSFKKERSVDSAGWVASVTVKECHGESYYPEAWRCGFFPSLHRNMAKMPAGVTATTLWFNNPFFFLPLHELNSLRRVFQTTHNTQLKFVVGVN